MMIKNIENRFKLAIIISIGSLLTSLVIVIIVVSFSFSLIQKERNKIYVLDNETPVLVKQTNFEVNMEVECKSHVNLFHTMFFTLPPDDKFIAKNMDRAMYLVDESGLKQYNNLKEKGYFNTIMASSASLSIITDSIDVDTKSMNFKYYGIQRIERPTSILKRQLITEGHIEVVPRTENNPHGLLITNWKTVLNKDLEYKAKKSF